MHEILDTGLLICAGLVAVGILTSLISFRFGSPLLLVFLLVGLGAGEDGIGGINFDDAKLAYAICSIALAVVLFDSGFETRLSSYRVAARPAILMSTLGVLVTMAIVAPTAHWLLDVDWLAALLIGAVISSTDAAAVFFLMRVGGAVVRDRVRSTLEIESGTNDPMAVFLTGALLAFADSAGNGSTGWMLALDFLREMGVGTAMGIAGGYALAAALRRLPLERALVPLFSLSLALCLFAGTNMLHGSGYLAVYLAGLVLGNKGIEGIASIKRFQGAFTWLAQIVMFITLGLLATPSEFVAIALPTLALGAVLMFFARPLAAWICLKPFGFTSREIWFVGWVGLRGAVSILLAILPLIAGIPGADIVFNVAFELVLLSLLLQGWTLVPAARRLKQLIPARRGPVERVALDLPGLAEFEMVCYRIPDQSPIARGARLPRWSRPSLVVRGTEAMRINQAGPLQVGDLVYLIVPDERIPLLDRIFASPREPERGDRAFFGDFEIDPDVALGELATSYGVSSALRDAGLTVGEVLAREFDGAPTAGDRLRIGPLELIVRTTSDAGRVTEVGLKIRTG